MNTRLLLVGGGHAMMPLLVAADQLVAAGVAVTLVNDVPRLYYSGMTPEYLGGVYTHEQVTIDLEAWCARTGVRFVRGQVVALDAGTRHVTTTDGAQQAFDLAAFDVGARTPGMDDAQGAIPTKPLHRIEALEVFVREALRAKSGTRRLVVVGGGAAGVEVALNVAARTRAVRPDALATTLLEPASHLLGPFPRRLRRLALDTLQAYSVEVRLATRAEAADAEGVQLAGGARLATDAVLWATGTEGQAFFRETGLPMDDDGFVHVTDTLQVRGAPHLFVAGDAAAVAGHEGLARVGVHAVKQGPVLRDNVFAAIAALAAGREPGEAPLRSFRPYLVAPLILSTGAPTGWMKLGPLSVTGTSVLRLKHLVDRRWMHRYHLGAKPYAALADARSASEGPTVSPSRRMAPGA